MRAPQSRRALRLASALVAAGLCMSVSPQALAADDSGSAMKLTGTEAASLTDRVAIDPYGDTADDSTVSPKSDETSAALDAAKAADSGSGLDDSSTAGSSADAVDPKTKVTLTAGSTLEGVRGMGATVPVGKNGDYFTFNSMGYVQRHAADGSETWARTSSSFFTDWQVKPTQPWRVEPYPAQILMGYNAVSPFAANSDNGYSTGDLTGDGVPDIVFSAQVGTTPYPRPFTSPGSSLTTGTFVTVLDGRTGDTRWSKLYNRASMVKIVDGTLLVADAPRMSSDSRVPAAATATLTGIRFASAADGALTPAQTWTYDTGEARKANWGDIQDLGKGKIAVSWNLAKATGIAARGRTLVLDTADGSVTWQTDSMLYGRQLRVDAGRKRIVALEQQDSTDAVHYEVASYDLKTGHRATLEARDNVLPTALTVGDLTAKDGDEYAVAESSLDENYYVNASTVRVLDGTDPDKLLWSSTVKRDAANAKDAASIWRLQVADGKLVTSAQDDREINGAGNPGGGRYASLTVYNAKGVVSWQSKGVAAAPMYQDVFSDSAGTHVRIIDQAENIRTFKLANGKAEDVTPLLADIGYAKAVDLNKDGRNDVVMAGSSDGVWAYSGPSLVSGKPEKLWQATVPGAVHDVETGDVNGDGRPEIVVAADTAVVVLNGKTGKTLATIEGGEGQYVRSAKLADLDGDGELDILVPTDALRAYYGDGHALWTYSAPQSAGDVRFTDPSVNDGQVYAAYAGLDAYQLTDPVTDAVALNAKNGKARWDIAPKAPTDAVGPVRTATPNDGILASEEIPYADGHAVVYQWNVTAPININGAESLSPRNYFEIRDGRTGEVLHSGYEGGLWTHFSYWAEDGVLYEGGTAAFRRYEADGKDSKAGVVAQSYGGGFMTGPGGRKLLVAGADGGLDLWDPSIFDSSDTWSGSVGGASLMGARNYLAADLDGDGVDEALSLAGDDNGFDRTAEEFGGRYYIPNNAIHQVTTYKLS
ncbi:VCBS repeat-containing protein [Streptomyces adustus]|uniref:VCBS repeat-containing protein n=1 Tax=Streptomyces adustus TaxID=1609272 RepID=A0A5N8V8R6_9ACTN|nr:VCBS repeat-containing protein [Streptomyces adustus]MPY31022.1 VCBS repeat-containing protein [Streptomyces adustus]